MTAAERIELFQSIKQVIIHDLEKMGYTGDLTDLGNEIGIAVSKHTCKDGKDLNIEDFDRISFIEGFKHGYSLNDGTH